MLKFYNTLTRKKQVFKPIKEGNVSMYSCGPTVYNYPHIGNYRSYVFSDLLKRYLRYKGFNVKHVMNITDVDDKTIRDSQKEGVSLKEFTTKYENGLFEDLSMLNVMLADHYPRATENIPEMINIIKRLLEKEIAYKEYDGSVYYHIEKFKNYGKLANIKIKDLKAGASGRIKKDEYDKEHVQDFALWKAWDKDDGDVFWDTDIGKGRPGWHIECSAMSMKFLGESFDIHTGGIDLVFPHHQNEIAQSEGCTDKKFVNFWIHNEWLLVDGKKMSKSLGNFYTLRDVLDKGFDPISVRYLLLSTHYRQQLNFTFDGLDYARNSLQRIQDFMLKLSEADNIKDNSKVKKIAEKARKQFEKFLDDDLEISSALAVVFDMIRDINVLLYENKLGRNDAETVKKQMLDFDRVLGILKKEEEIPEEIKILVDERKLARKNKDWKRSDELRNLINNKGYVVEDTLKGARVKKL